MRKSVIILIVILLISFGIYVFVRQTGKTNSLQTTPQQTIASPTITSSTFNKNDNLDQALQDLETINKKINKEKITLCQIKLLTSIIMY